MHWFVHVFRWMSKLVQIPRWCRRRLSTKSGVDVQTQSDFGIEKPQWVWTTPNGEAWHLKSLCADLRKAQKAHQDALDAEQPQCEEECFRLIVEWCILGSSTRWTLSHPEQQSDSRLPLAWTREQRHFDVPQLWQQREKIAIIVSVIPSEQVQQSCSVVVVAVFCYGRLLPFVLVVGCLLVACWLFVGCLLVVCWMFVGCLLVVCWYLFVDTY